MNATLNLLAGGVATVLLLAVINLGAAWLLVRTGVALTRMVRR